LTSWSLYVLSRRNQYKWQLVYLPPPQTTTTTPEEILMKSPSITAPVSDAARGKLQGLRTAVNAVALRNAPTHPNPVALAVTPDESASTAILVINVATVVPNLY
jgi:hypothetical protein